MSDDMVEGVHDEALLEIWSHADGWKSSIERTLYGPNSTNIGFAHQQTYQVETEDENFQYGGQTHYVV